MGWVFCLCLNLTGRTLEDRDRQTVKTGSKKGEEPKKLLLRENEVSSSLWAIFTWRNEKSSSHASPPHLAWPLQDLVRSRSTPLELHWLRENCLGSKTRYKTVALFHPKKWQSNCLEASSMKSSPCFANTIFSLGTSEVKAAVWLTVAYLARNESTAELPFDRLARRVTLIDRVSWWHGAGSGSAGNPALQLLI